MVVGAVLMFIAGTFAVTAAAHRSGRPTARNGPWIAYSNAPACAADGPCATGGEQSYAGSNVFMIRAGGSPELVARRGSRSAWDICPVFSPNGRMLAFARERGSRSTIVVVRIGAEGPIPANRRVVKVPTGSAHCPRWSANSSRLAYLSGGHVIVFGLDGKRLARANGDPTIDDFVSTPSAGILSPTGKLIARQLAHGGRIVVSRPDGSDPRDIPEQGGGLPGEPSYGIAGWSPDGRKLLLMYDTGGARISAVSVSPPFRSTTIVDHIPVDNARLWPGYGDVSWQPKPRRP
jgi:Tol biopolymer transport system component